MLVLSLRIHLGHSENKTPRQHGFTAHVRVVTHLTVYFRPAPVRMMPPRDPHAGLLLDREREWLMKIQIMQLHTDDPYTDDYYYTVSVVDRY